MVKNEIKPNEANLVTETCLLVIKRTTQKRNYPNEKRLEKTEKKEGKWKRNGEGKERERGDREKKRALPPADQGAPSTSPRLGLDGLPADEPAQLSERHSFTGAAPVVMGVDSNAARGSSNRRSRTLHRFTAKIAVMAGSEQQG